MTTTGNEPKPLTDLQARAFELAGDGLTHKEIAAHMGVSESMAIQHIKIVRTKLGIAHKRDLVKAARNYFE